LGINLLILQTIILGGDKMSKKQTNDSMEQKKAKQQNQQTKDAGSMRSKHTDGPNHPST